MKNIVSCCILCFLFVPGVYANPPEREVRARILISPERDHTRRKEVLKERETSPEKVISTALKMESRAISPTDLVPISQSTIEAYQKADIYLLPFEDYKYELDRAIEIAKILITSTVTASEKVTVSENQIWFISLIAGLLDKEVADSLCRALKIHPTCDMFFDASSSVREVFSIYDYQSLFNEKSLRDFYLTLSLMEFLKAAKTPLCFAEEMKCITANLWQVINYAPSGKDELLEQFKQVHSQFQD